MLIPLAAAAAAPYSIYQPTNIPSQVLRPSVSWGTRGCSVNIFLVILGGEWRYYDNTCFNWVSSKQAQAPPTSDEATVPGARPAWLWRKSILKVVATWYITYLDLN